MPHTTAATPTRPESPQDVLICTRCGGVFEFDGDSFDALGTALAKRLGFELTSHRLELFGRCPSCRWGGPAGARWGRA